MTTPVHPSWCSIGRCTIAGNGAHESEPARVNGRGRGRPPRMLLMLSQREHQPVRLRMVVIGDHLINTLDIDLDTADLAARTITKVIALAAPVE